MLFGAGTRVQRPASQSRVTLFDDFLRTEMRNARHTEPAYTFFNNSAWRAVVHIRSLLEEWFTHFPLASQTQISGSLLS